MSIRSTKKKRLDSPCFENISSPAQFTSKHELAAFEPNNFNEYMADSIFMLTSSGSYLYRYAISSGTWSPVLPLGTTWPYLSTTSTIKCSGSHGYYNSVLAASSNTITTGLPAQSVVGYRIKIVSGKGAGQERLITGVTGPVIVDRGQAGAGTTATNGGIFKIVDPSKTWYGYSLSSGVVTGSYTGSIGNVNGYSGYVVRVIPTSTVAGRAQDLTYTMKILYNSQTELIVSDFNHLALNPYSYIYYVPGANNATTSFTVGVDYQIECSTLTVDDNWNIQPDTTSRFVIQSGAIWSLGSGLTNLYTSYYDLLDDKSYILSNLSILTTNNSYNTTDPALEIVTENQTIWHTGKATYGSLNTLYDTKANWKVNQWIGYKLYIYSGSGKGQMANISSNTANTLIFNNLATAIDNTSNYNIMGYDGGTSSGSNTYESLIDSTKSWGTNRYANYGVRILYGKGAGQSRQIKSNTATSLILYEFWNVLPDNTSVYIIEGYNGSFYIGGGRSTIGLYNLGAGNSLCMPTLGRVFYSGVACTMAALPCSSTHEIYEQPAVAISLLSGTTTITATTAQAHNLKVDQYVSIRGVTSSASDVYNVTGCVQITSVPSTTTFTYTPYAAGSGTYGSNAQTTSRLVDSSKSYIDLATSTTSNTITFARATPSNINGWYAVGYTTGPYYSRVISGAGTTTITLADSYTPSPTAETIYFSPIMPGSGASIDYTYSSGGGAGVATITFSTNILSSANGYYITGVGIAEGTKILNGAGTATLALSKAMTGSASGTYSIYPPDGSEKLLLFNTSNFQSFGSASFASGMTKAVSGGGVLNTDSTFASAPIDGISKYTLSNPSIVGAIRDGYAPAIPYSRVTTGGANSFTDSTLVWSSATGTGSAQGTTITLSAVAPLVDGWYVTGTGINIGTRVVSGSGTNIISVDIPFNSAVSGTITFCALGPSGGSSVLVGQSVRFLTSSPTSAVTGACEFSTTAVTPGTGAVSISTVSTTTTIANSVYSFSACKIGQGGAYRGVACLQYGNSDQNTRGRYLIMQSPSYMSWHILDINTDKLSFSTPMPWAEGSYFIDGDAWVYDHDRIYIFKRSGSTGTPARINYVDVNNKDSSIGFATVPTTGVSGFENIVAATDSRMCIVKTEDGLKYLYVVSPDQRSNQPPIYRLLLDYDDE